MFSPLLAPREDPMGTPDYFQRIQYPLLVSPKLDGIRNVVRNSQCVSRKLIAFPSLQVQSMFSMLEHRDGELAAGCETDWDLCHRTDSHTRAKNKPHPEMRYRVFDWADEDWQDMPFEDRLAHLTYETNKLGDPNVSVVEHTLVQDETELLAFEEAQLAMGYEGIMMRDPKGRYKNTTRCTFREGIIYKLKRFRDEEGIVIGFVEQQTNNNEQLRDNLGNAKRSTKAEGMSPANTLGKFLVQFGELVVEVPPGVFKHVYRKYIWDHQDEFIGKMIKFRHFPHGAKDTLRMPRAINQPLAYAWRTLEDI